MTQDPNTEGRQAGQSGEARTTRFLGSLKDALVAASREEPTAREGSDIVSAAPVEVRNPAPVKAHTPPPTPSASSVSAAKSADSASPETVPSAASAAKAVRGTSRPLDEHQIQLHKLPTTRVVKASDLKQKDDSKTGSADMSDQPARTQLVRGKLKVERGAFERDPVVGWVVVVGGPGIGNYRPIFEGNNSVGRGSQNRIPIDFGDEAISSEEQAYIRYDSSDRSFLFVPNLAKTNVVSVNNEKPTGAVKLNQMDVIVMGRTQLVFVPFCGSEFDWSALGETAKG